MKSKIISISAISAGFVALFLIIGTYITVTDVFAIVVSSVFVLLPLYYKSFKGCFMAYLVGAVICTLVCLPTILTSFVLPAFVCFFGIYPIIKFIMQEKKVNKIVSYVIGLVWCVIAFYGIYFYYTLVAGFVFTDIPLFISKYIYVFVGLFAIAFFVIYERFLVFAKAFIDRYLGKIVK